MTNAVSRLSAALSGRYTIERELGQGGMATVYLAHDARHDRRVALKLLRPELAAILGADRFLAEIKTTANLQHPHILSLFDSGEVDGLVFYVMPYVEGESLRDRLKREHQLPIDDAVRITREVADALDYAHRHHVIHRDIKPENILLHDGRALVADFGIALAVSRSDGGTRMTETGMSLGTPHYMAPEQAMGEKEITPKADVYALGCVLYEMLAGEPPFNGPTAQAIIARVMTEAPRPLTLQRHTIPPHVDAAVRTALEKLPADRFATAAEFAAALNDLGFARGATAASGRDASRAARPWWRARQVWGAAALALTAAAVGRYSGPRTASPPLVARFRMPIESERGVTGGPVNTLALSPDGQTIVYVGRSVGGTGAQLYERPLGELATRPIAGTQGGAFPAFSPNGKRLFFLTGSGAFVVPVPFDGTTPTHVLGPTSQALATAAWLDDATLVVTNNKGEIERLGLDGAAATVARPDRGAGEQNLFASAVLPDGRTVLAIASTGTNSTGRVLAIDTRSGERRVVLETAATAAWYADGCLLWSQPNGALLAARFDPRSRRLTSSAVSLAEGVRQAVGGGGQAAVSASGSLVYLPEQPFSLVVMDRTGRREVVSEGHRFHSPRFSPDGRRLAVDFIQQGERDVWTLDLRQRTLSRLSFENDGHDPIWSPDGRWIGYVHGNGVWRRRADGSGAPDSIYARSVGATALEYTPDGSRLLVALTAAVGFDIGVLPPGGRGDAAALLATPYNEQAATLSPDGRWMAYSSDETGKDEVYVQPFPNGGAKALVSQGGGNEPRWSSDGRTIYYVGQRDGLPYLIAAAITAGQDLSVRTRTMLFDVSEFEPASPHANYDISPDGTRFALVHQGALSEMVFVFNWTAEVRRRTATGAAR